MQSAGQQQGAAYVCTMVGQDWVLVALVGGAGHARRSPGERSREVQRLEKLLEDAADQVVRGGRRHSGRVRARHAGGIDRRQPRPATLADLAKRRLRSKIPALTEALTGRFTDALLARVHLDLIDSAQRGHRRDHHPHRGHDQALSLVSRPDLHTPTPTSAPDTAGSPHAADPKRPTSRSSTPMLIAIWHIGTNGCLYNDLGADYFNRLHPSEQKRGPSTNSRPSATRSPSPTPVDHRPHENLRVRRR